MGIREQGKIYPTPGTLRFFDESGALILEVPDARQDYAFIPQENGRLYVEQSYLVPEEAAEKVRELVAKPGVLQTFIEDPAENPEENTEE